MMFSRYVFNKMLKIGIGVVLMIFIGGGGVGEEAVNIYRKT